MSDGLRAGGIVLCGGESKRMGVHKATLPFGSELMLQRVVRLLSQVVEPIVVVAAAGQRLPELASSVIVARDERECCGPLEGLRAGIAAISPHADAAYATSCDVPLLSAAFVCRMIVELDEHDAAVPVDGDLFHPLAAVYRISILASIELHLEHKHRRTSDLFNSVATHRVPVQDLRSVDPELLTLMNVNTPSDYAKALQLAGLSIDESIEKRLRL